MHPCYLALGRRAAKTVSVCYHKYAHYECCATVGHEPIMFTSPPPLSLSLSAKLHDTTSLEQSVLVAGIVYE